MNPRISTGKSVSKNKMFSIIFAVIGFKDFPLDCSVILMYRRDRSIRLYTWILYGPHVERKPHSSFPPPIPWAISRSLISKELDELWNWSMYVFSVCQIAPLDLAPCDAGQPRRHTWAPDLERPQSPLRGRRSQRVDAIWFFFRNSD